MRARFPVRTIDLGSARWPAFPAVRRLILLVAACSSALPVAAGGLVLSGLLPLSGTAHAQEAITVTLDRAKILRITKPAATVVIGNPAIVDATMPDAQTLILTGKSFGTTNLVIMDRSGQQIADRILNVRMPQDNTVVIQRGVARYTYNCTPTCERTVAIGDANTSDGLVHYDTLIGNLQSRNKLSSNQDGDAGGDAAQ